MKYLNLWSRCGYGASWRTFWCTGLNHAIFSSRCKWRVRSGQIKIATKGRNTPSEWDVAPAAHEQAVIHVNPVVQSRLMACLCSYELEPFILHYYFVLLDLFPPYLLSSLISLSLSLTLLLLIFLVYFLIKFAGEYLELSLTKCRKSDQNSVFRSFKTVTLPYILWKRWNKLG